MSKVRLGKSEIVSEKNGFGVLPIQRISFDEAEKLILKAYDAGITYFDTARFYTDSEQKLGRALKGKRHHVTIATKTMCNTTDEFWAQLDQSLTDLNTDYIDLYQFHNPDFCPKPGDGSGLYEAMLEAKKQGKILHIGITNHRLAIADEAVESGLYETMQFPFSYLASPEDLALAEKCRDHDMGFIAMKALSGGLITRADVAYAFCDKYDYVLPIWGVQKMSELDDFLACAKNPPVYDGAMEAFVAKEREQLAGDFCRGCGYCLPCPQGINIPDCARMSLLIRRAPVELYMNDDYQAQMQQVKECIHCDQCKGRCPYGLDTPALLEKNLKDYEQQLAAHH
ncbi:aldo/keto reductase [Aminicella lysinilytica]|uniref:aldo/keto reductase n=1 Tax=Aminicella lysinilytica TaxID=433323 RepID=UPI0026EA3264|nr:aldo/keto reductase [Aminicella lysinilytica]